TDDDRSTSSPLSLHDALPISGDPCGGGRRRRFSRPPPPRRTIRRPPGFSVFPVPVPGLWEGCPAPLRGISPPSPPWPSAGRFRRSEEHTSELQSRENLVCRLL